MIKRAVIYSGQSLLGLMFSIMLSSFLLLVIVQFYTQTQRENYWVFKRLYLQSEIQRSLQLMGKDLRRAGFRAVTAKLTESNFPLFELDEQGKSINITHATQEKANSCILFLYDLDATGCVGTTYKSGSCITKGKNTAKDIERELFGYRLNNGMLETRLTYKNAINPSCSQTQCRSYLQQNSCNGGGWADLLDSTEISVTHLVFRWLIENKLLEIEIAAKLKRYPQIQYESRLVTPLLNQGEEK